MSLFKSASTVSLFTLASRVTGLVREFLMASMFGASALTDAFQVAWRIPNLFRRFFAEGAFSQAFVPVLAATKESHGDEATRRVIDDIASLLVVAVLVTSVVGVLGAGGLVLAMGSGLRRHPEAFDAAVVMTRWMFPYIAFMSLVALCAGVLNTWRRFAVPAATPVLLNLSVIGAIYWLSPWLERQGVEPIYAMAFGVMLGGVLQLAMQLAALHALQLLPRLALGWGDLRRAWTSEAAQRVSKLMGAALLSVGVAQISMVINTQIASSLRAGSVTWITYADRLMELPVAMLGVALGVVLTPQLSAARAAKDDAGYSDMLDWGLRIVVLLALPCSVALVAFGQPLVAVLLQYGKFTQYDVAQTCSALIGWGVGLLGLVAVKVLAPGFFASQDMKTPVKISIGVLVITQVLNGLLVPYLAHAALTLSIGLGALVNALWMLIGLTRRGSYRPRKGWWFFLLRVITASALLAVFFMWANAGYDWTSEAAKGWGRAIRLALCLGASVAIYFAALMASGLKLRTLLRR